MRIAISTMTGENYGSALQAYALQQALSINKNEVRTIKIVPGCKLKNYLGRNLRLILADPQNVKRLYSDLRNKIKYKKIHDFYDQRMAIIKVKSPEQVEDSFDPHVYVCGSDQIWNPQFQPNKLFYLDFFDSGKKRYSYACSLAVDQIPDESINYYKNKLKQFSGISVREQTGKRLLDMILNTAVRVDVDPVLLYEADYWDKLKSTKYSGGGYALLYMLRPSDELVACAEEFSRATGETIIYMGDYYYKSKIIRFSGKDGVEDFLSALIHADYVITNSFHATILSVLFEKNFCSMVIERTGSRVSDFLKDVNLEDRIIQNESLVSLFKREPDFSAARYVVAKKRQESLVYIQNIVNLK